MTSEPVSKLIAIGLREINFDVPNKKYYGWDDKIHSGRTINHNDWCEYNECYSAPTIDECINYLLNKHGVCVVVTPSYPKYNFNQWTCEFYIENTTPKIVCISDNRSQALTAGIEAAINHIKNKMKNENKTA